MSKAAIALIKRLLEPNTSDRVTPDDALQDPWFEKTLRTEDEKKIMKGIKKQALLNLKSFKSALTGIICGQIII